MDKSELEMSAYIEHSSIELWGHFGNINGAKQLFDFMTNTNCDCIALDAIINAYMKQNDNNYAFILYKYAIEKNELSNILTIN